MKTTARARLQAGLLSLLSLFIVTLFLLFLGTDEYNSPNLYPLVRLDDGWTISRGNETWEPESLTESNIGIIDSGETIMLTRTLPDINLDPATISFKTLLSTIDVFVGDIHVYTFGEKYYNDGQMLPKMINFVQLPSGYQGKELKIVITAREDDAFSGLAPVYLGNYNDLFNNLLQKNRLSMVIGVYLVLLAFLLLIMSPFLIFSAIHDYSIMFGALTSWTLGSYILCYNDIFWIFAESPGFYTFVEYLSLFSIPAAFLGFVIATRQIAHRKIGILLFLINVVFVVSTSILHISGFIHVNSFVWVLHILGMMEGVFIIVSLIINTVRTMREDSSQSTTSTHVLIVGLFMFLVCELIDILKFNILKFSKSGEINSSISFVTIGALIFMMCLMLNYFYHCIEYISKSSQREHLEGIAYNDSLTGLQNRARCEQVLAELSGDYTIVSLDMDYLKYTNDNYGHAYGDRLLSGFSEILKNSFTDARLIGRMGGDEFIAVLPYIDDERTKRDLSNLQDQLDYRNSRESKLRFSASWGYASSRDKEVQRSLTAQNVYLLADQRMYLMKNKHHKETLGRLYDDLLNKVLEKEGDL